MSQIIGQQGPQNIESQDRQGIYPRTTEGTEAMQNSVRDTINGANEKQGIPDELKSTDTYKQYEEGKLTYEEFISQSEAKDSEEELEGEEKLEQEDDPYNYMLRNLLEGGHLSPEKTEEIKADLENMENDEEKRKYLSGISEEIGDKKTRESFKKTLEEDRDVTPNTFNEEPFYKDSLGLLDLSEGYDGLDKMLATGYFETFTPDGFRDKRRDINSSMDVVTSNIIKEQGKDFKTANATIIGEIRNASSIQTKYNSLVKLYKEHMSKGGEHASENNKESRLGKQKESMTKEYQRLKGEYASVDASKKQEIFDKLQKLIESAKNIDIELEKGDADLGGGREDKSPESPEKERQA